MDRLARALVVLGFLLLDQKALLACCGKPHVTHLCVGFVCRCELGVRVEGKKGCKMCIVITVFGCPGVTLGGLQVLSPYALTLLIPKQVLPHTLSNDNAVRTLS